MRLSRFVGCFATITVALFAGGALATSSGSTVTAQASLDATIDFTLAPPDQQPTCLMAIGGIVSWTGDYLAHASPLPGDLVRVWGDAAVDFTAGDYTATAKFTYDGISTPDANAEVIVMAPVDVDFVSSKSPDVVKTIFRFEAGANVGDSGILPWSLALQKYMDITCR